MRIVPYQTRDLPGKVSNLHPLPCPDPDTPDFFISYTHERNGNTTGPFFRTVFRVEDHDQILTDSHLQLRYTNQLNASSLSLSYDETCKCWEQQNDRSINTAGVYSVSLISTVSQKTIFTIRVQVIPSNIDYGSYMWMLSDLIRIHEELILDMKSSVNSAERINEADYLSVEQINRLIELLPRVMSLSSESQKKQYYKTQVNRIKRMDSRTLRDCIRHDFSGRVQSVTYAEDHDTYENRVIRYVLEQLRSRVISRKYRISVQGDTISKLENQFQTEQHSIESMIAREQLNAELQDNVNAQKKFIATARAKYKAESDYYEKLEVLTNFLSLDWFKTITPLSDLPEIKLTPKFNYHVFYHQIYDILLNLLSRHVAISDRLDTKLLGVKPTHEIYEYWVFYQIMDHLRNLGFQIKVGARTIDDTIRYFRNFIQHSELEKKSGLIFILEKRDCNLRLEVGYERVFLSSPIGGKKRTPDYSFLVQRGRNRHWYFMDAKYKPFSNSGPDNYRTLLQRVSIDRYTTEMSEILAENGQGGIVCGSYLISPNIDEGIGNLSLNNRLFGSWEEFCGYSLSGAQQLPRHRYGIIKLSPSYKQELVTVFQLIFEYLEAESSKDISILDFCWRCGHHISRTSQSTKGDRIKYYSTCPCCGAFRVDTHCYRCKHILIKHSGGNYHSFTKRSQNSWNFSCPNCGDGL